jgi:hypothetical protein
LSPPRYNKILCLEGDWDGELTSRSSVLPMLELLERLRRVEFVHKDVGTRAELAYYLRQWAEDDSVGDYSMLYLAFHGSTRTARSTSEHTVWISGAADGEVTLTELAGILGPDHKDEIIHFGSCSLLAEKSAVLERFLNHTGIKAIAGYDTDIDWVASAAMDLMFFDTVARYSQWAAAKRALDNDNGVRSLRKSLGFKIFPG